MMEKEKTEARIQQEIVAFLQGRKIFCHSVPNEAGGRSMAMQSHLVAMGLRSGVADLVVWWPDGIGYLEVKDRKGRQSQRQEVFERMCHEHGIDYSLARSVEDVAGMLERKERKMRDIKTLAKQLIDELAYENTEIRVLFERVEIKRRNGSRRLVIGQLLETANDYIAMVIDGDKTVYEKRYVGVPGLDEVTELARSYLGKEA